MTVIIEGINFQVIREQSDLIGELINYFQTFDGIEEYKDGCDKNGSLTQVFEDDGFDFSLEIKGDTTIINELVVLL